MINELLAEFAAENVLQADTQTKSVVLLGTIKDQQAILTVEKTAFPTDATPQLADLVSSPQLINHNDIYYWSLGLLAANAAGAKINLIYPATEKHLRKYAAQRLHMVRETPQMYACKVAPFIETQKGDQLQWVRNILLESKEADTIVHDDRDPHHGFVLLPDMKWDGRTMDALYLCVIVRRTDIASLRDLRGTHVGYLEEMQRKISAATCSTYRLEPDQLRIFVHYQPSYYHFHIHVVNVAHPGLGGGINAGKAVLLDDVISNLRLAPDYYERQTLTYQLGEMHPLWEILNGEAL